MTDWPVWLALALPAGFLLLLVAIAAPVEWAARRHPRFREALDRFIDRMLGGY